MTQLFASLVDKSVHASDVAVTIRHAFSSSVYEDTRFEDVLMEHDQEGGVDVEEGFDHVGQKVDTFSSILLHDDAEGDIIGMMLIEHVKQDGDGFKHIFINTLLDDDKLDEKQVTEAEANKALIDEFFDQFRDDVKGNSVMSHVDESLVNMFQDKIMFHQLEG